MADALAGAIPDSRNSLIRLIVPLAVLTVVAAAAGGVLGRLIVAQANHTEVPKAAEVPQSAYAGDLAAWELKPIIANLAAPAGALVRLQVALIYESKAIAAPEPVAAEIGSDFLGYLKTLSLTQLQGASGLLHLREDLTERAGIRSDGRVREVVVETLVVQ